MHPFVVGVVQIHWKIARTQYHIRVDNPHHRQRGVSAATLDGRPVDYNAIPLVDDGEAHTINLVMGEATAGAKEAERIAVSRQ